MEILEPITFCFIHYFFLVHSTNQSSGNCFQNNIGGIWKTLERHTMDSSRLVCPPSVCQQLFHRLITQEHQHLQTWPPKGIYNHEYSLALTENHGKEADMKQWIREMLAQHCLPGHHWVEFCHVQAKTLNYHYCMAALTGAAWRLSRGPGIEPQSSNRFLGKLFWFHFWHDKNAGLNKNQTYVTQCASQSGWPLGHLYLKHYIQQCWKDLACNLTAMVISSWLSVKHLLLHQWCCLEWYIQIQCSNAFQTCLLSNVGSISGPLLFCQGQTKSTFMFISDSDAVSPTVLCKEPLK